MRLAWGRADESGTSEVRIHHAFSTHSQRRGIWSGGNGRGELFGVQAFCVFVVVSFEVFAIDGNFLAAVACYFFAGE
ncbi:MAG: hypothetical protein AB9882_09270 [Ignavibacteriaceae bacterium]